MALVVTRRELCPAARTNCCRHFHRILDCFRAGIHQSISPVRATGKNNHSRMNPLPSPAPPGRVASLHLHPAKPGAPLQALTVIEVVAAKGIRDNPRYFGRVSQSTGAPSRRQVSLIEREQIAEHAATLGLENIPSGAVRSNIETEGVNLQSLVGHEVAIGTAMLRIYQPRDPCHKMDLICQGLRELMEDNRQGVLAEVVRSGTIQVGDLIRLRPPA